MFARYILPLLLLAGLWSCQDESSELVVGQNLVFTGEVREKEAEISTRGPASDLVQRGNFDTQFYFERLIGDNRKCSTYLIPEQRPGVFRSYASNDSLTWNSRNELHTYYAWTMPWKDRDTYIDDVKNNPGLDGRTYETIISFNSGDPMYADVPKDDNTNCKILETFIGAKNGPITFLDNGEYVNMQFKHLVSKIYINRLQVSYINDKNLLAQSNITGRMIMYNLPSEGIFIREGENGPMVKANPKCENEVSYQVGPETALYICPGVDISKIEFRIVDHNFKNGNGDFFGNFNNVVIERDPNDWWDIENPETNILYAGEVLTLNISLRQGIGSVIAATIDGWDTQKVREGSVYGKSGFYDGSNLRYIYDTLNKNYDDEDLQKRMFELYGDQATGEYHLFADLTKVSHGFRLGRDYVLNGMGHSVTFDTYDNGTVYISKAYDIYLSDGKGNTLYIDNDFNVYKVNPDGSMTKTGQLDPLEEGKNSYNINIKTGEVVQHANY